MKSRPPAQPNISLIAGLKCLGEVSAHGEPLGVRELGRRLKMEPTRANRLMKTLSSEGYLVQNEKGKYEAGPAMHLLSALSLRSSQLLVRAMPALEALSEFQSVIALGMLWRNQVVYLFHADPGEPASAGLAREPIFPATRSSIGLSLIAKYSEQEIHSLYPEEIPGFDSMDALMKKLQSIRKNGYASIAFRKDIFSVGVAIDDHSAIALGSIHEKQIPRAAKALKKAREVICSTRS